VPRRLSLVILAAAALAAAAAGPAAAQPDDTREFALHERPVAMVPADLHVTWRSDGVLATQVTTDPRTSDGREVVSTASVAAEVAISHEGCDVLVAGGQVDARAGAASPLAFQQWASLCPLAGVTEIAFGHRLSWDVQPRLLAPPRMRPGLTRQETVDFDMLMLRTRVNRPDPLSLRAPAPPVRMLFGGMGMKLDVAWQSDGSRYDFDVTSHGHMIGVERERADGGDPLQVWLFSIVGHVMAYDAVDAMESRSAMTARADLFEIHDARLGPLVVDADLGLAIGSVTPVDDAGRPATSLTTGVGHVAVARSSGPDHKITTVSVSAGREHWPLWDGRLVVDDRVTVALAVTGRRMRTRAEASLGRLHLIAARTPVTTAVTGGLTSILDRDLGRHVTVRVRTEVGWSVYAPGATPEAPRPAIESLVSAVVHLGNR